MLGLKQVRSSLAVKLALWLVLSTVVLFSVFGYMNLNLQQQQAEALVLQSAHRISDLIQRSTHYLMLRNDREALHEVIKTIGSEPGIRRIRIFNEEGRISVSTAPEETGRFVDKRAEACYVCHAQEAPLTRLNRPDRARTFTDEQGRRVLGLIQPIENEPGCSNAGCHAHPPDRRILGVIDTDLSLATVDAQLATQMAELGRFTALALAVLALLSVAFVWIFVHRPVTELTEGTQRVAGGDLGYRLPVHSRDELGRMAVSFNKMTGELAEARAELTSWAHSLESRVTQKTRELEQAQSHLISSEKMASLGKLAATVAHEVNNPLAGILTYARLALRRLETEPCREETRKEMADQLHIIVRESRRCGDIMKNLLTFARQAPTHRQLNNPNVLLERAFQLIQHQLELQGIELVTSVPKDLSEMECDAGQVQQALLALLVNATEAMPHGGQLTVEARPSPDGQTLCLTIGDTGAGIAPEALPHIFDPFYTTKEESQRAGLGLAVASSIVEQHGGAIAVDSEPNKGTRMRINLPFKPPMDLAATEKVA